MKEGAKIPLLSSSLRSVEFIGGSEQVINDSEATNGSNSSYFFFFLTNDELSGIMLGADYKILKFFGHGGSTI